jgi:BASS family bile acid:Na+ symporter
LSETSRLFVNVDTWINLLVSVTLVEMMIAIGLGVSPSDVVVAAKQWPLMGRAALANYVAVPIAAVVLLLLFHAKPMVAAGFLILAVCPGAPYAPPFTTIAKGDVVAAVGLMVVLASSSAILAPLMLAVLLPLVASDAPVHIDGTRLLGTLLLTQLLPLCAGIGLRAWRPSLAAKLLSPANRLSTILNLTAIAFILTTQIRTFLQIRLAAFGGMFVLLLASLAAGWVMGGATREARKTMALVTSLRNVGVSMVIAAGSFPGTPALTAILAYAVVELLGSLALALWWGRRARGLQGVAGTLY